MKSTSASASPLSSPPASPTTARRIAPFAPWKPCSSSASSACAWATKTSTITTGCAPVRCWPCSPSRPTPPLAGKSTPQPPRRSPVRAHARSRYCKISARLDAIADFLVEAFIQQQTTPPTRLVLDVDATDASVHGHQFGRFFHGDYCYLPLYAFCGDHPLVARLLPADIDAAAGALEQVQRQVARLRQQWPAVAIVLRADSGFCREHLLRWCEANGVDYVIGLARNRRL